MTISKTAKSQFTEFKAYKKLADLAKSPIDLTKKENLTHERVDRFAVSACGYKLLYATERVTEKVIDALKELAKETAVVEKMQKMHKGAKVNKIEGFESENRAALHTAVRDFFEEPIQEKEAKEASIIAKKEVDKLKDFVAGRAALFKDLVVIGIGGSELGPKACCVALEKYRLGGRRVHFVSNVDPDDMAQTLGSLDLKKTLVAVVSKSGTTLETRTNETIARKYFEKAELDSKKHFVAVTGEKSPMDDSTKYLESFYIWDFIGGRYSASSMVGGVPIAFQCGFDVFWEFLKGANAMDKVARIPDADKNLPLFGALLSVWNHNFLKSATLAIIPYSKALTRFPAHIQQLAMESNGKRIDRYGNAVEFQTCPIIWGEPGTNAQHSFFQLLHQGTEVVPMEFVGFKQSQFEEDLDVDGTTSQEKLLSNLFAQSLALAQGKDDPNPNKFFPGNRPSHILLSRKLTPFALGALLSYFENKVDFEGFIWGINSFDQEGVQLGKVLAKKILDRFAGKGDRYPLGDACIKQLDSL